MENNAKLEPDFKVKWIKALRSGKFEQCSHKLLRIDERAKTKTYCCLGVAAVVHGISEVQIENGEAYDMLPPLINGGMSNRLVSKLTGLNDLEKLSFDKIADYIEENL